ncbi:hypothetical protein CONPUDRAFT_149774 [Coniophora puteana RWD-64-598 SS2]|uniref:Uncharacterized protein n=1 Tax=Coniophora puteana (strain RWD-64-598) TaxID=741705 RepID=A0A5M3N1W2_CONPW|nr:uncharacterized protein CONPUDRAFT_149774 [Coniophora puteana RWD-64-598 SS2]EIW84905.1 hypothetical protein CONPUDRAFT_149774 [Coniophora puteana RWD-64-598 SS2]
MLINLITGILSFVRYIVVACVAGTAASILWLAGARAPRVTEDKAHHHFRHKKFAVIDNIKAGSLALGGAKPPNTTVDSLWDAFLLTLEPRAWAGHLNVGVKSAVHYALGQDLASWLTILPRNKYLDFIRSATSSNTDFQPSEQGEKGDKIESAAEVRARCIQVIKAGTARRIQLRMRSLSRVPLVRSHSAPGVPQIQKVESRVPEIHAESTLSTKVGLGISAVQGMNGAEKEAWWRAPTAAQMAGTDANARWANSVLRRDIAEMIKSRAQERFEKAQGIIRDQDENTVSGESRVLNLGYDGAGSPAALAPCSSVPKINIEAPSPGPPSVFSYAEAVKTMANARAKIPSKKSNRVFSESKGKNTSPERTDEGEKENNLASSDAGATLSWRRKVSRPPVKTSLFSVLRSGQNMQTSWDGVKHGMGAGGSKSTVQLR